jgi:cytochrome-b5 reductase
MFVVLLDVAAESGFSTTQVVLGALIGGVILYVLKKMMSSQDNQSSVGRGTKRVSDASASSSSASASSSASSSSSSSSAPLFLNRLRQKVPLVEQIQLSPDTYLFRFGLPTASTVLGLPVGKHFKVYAPNKVGKVEGEWNGREDSEAGKSEVVRSYTPTSSDDDLGHFDLVIKVYRGGVDERFVDGGKVSQYIDSLAIGDELEIAGPYGIIEYCGRSSFKIASKPVAKRNVGMIAGGTGITPMLQVIKAALKDDQDETKFWLLFANQTEDDILVRDMLEKAAAEHPERFKLWHTLDRPGDDWKYSSGFVNADMIREHLPAPSDDTIVFMCGPPPMINYACVPNLNEIGFAKSDQRKF